MKNIFTELVNAMPQHIAVAGSLGSGSITFVNKYIEELSDFTSIHFMKLKDEEGEEDFETSERVITERVDDLNAALAKVVNAIKEGQAAVFLITKFEVLSEHCDDKEAVDENLQFILQHGAKAGVVLMIVQCYSELKSLQYLKQFPIRICYHCSKEVSQELLGSDIAAKESTRGNIYKFDCTFAEEKLTEYLKEA